MNLQNKTILVTGGCGAIGGNLVSELVRIGCKDIIVLDNLSSGHQENLPNSNTVRFIKGSITDDKILDEVFKSKPEVVFHLAARFANQNSVEHPVEDLETNSIGTLKLLMRSKEIGTVKKFVYSSSSCVYGNKEGELTESDVYFKLDTPYAISKLTGEYYVKFFQGMYGLNTVILRYFNSYGPGERPGRYRNVIPNFIYKALNNQPLTITGSGEETRDFTYVLDTVNATIEAAQRDEAVGGIFNIGNGKDVSINELVSVIKELTGSNVKIEYIPRRGWDHISKRRSDISRAKLILGYSPRCSLKEGIIKTIEWFEQNNIKAIEFK